MSKDKNIPVEKEGCENMEGCQTKLASKSARRKGSSKVMQSALNAVERFGKKEDGKPH